MAREVIDSGSALPGTEAMLKLYQQPALQHKPFLPAVTRLPGLGVDT